jgi:hypothetical protein
MKAPIMHFPHRLNLNGSYDSICRLCFATVASARDEMELPPHESRHVCNPMWAYQAMKVVSLGIPYSTRGQ